MEIKEKIEYYLNQNKTIEETKNELINAHIEQINKVIEDRIIDLKEQLREDAIQTVCGEEYNVLNKEIEKNNRHIAILTEIEEETDFIDVLKEIIPAEVEKDLQTGENMPVNDLQGKDMFKEETTVVGTNQDTLDGMLS